MPGANIGYVRVSTVDQNLGWQLDGIELDKVFEDKISASTIDRPGWIQCNNFLREGDTLYVHSIDRLARSLVDLHNIVKTLNERGVVVRFLKEDMMFGPCEPSAFKVLHFQILGAFAQFERALLLERQREGIAKAKAAGKYKGRKPKLSEEQKAAVRQEKALGVPITKIAVKYGVGRPVIYEALKQGAAAGADAVAA
jgi:DNA invertase Pin-like site-specific DNA recombinase